MLLKIYKMTVDFENHLRKFEDGQEIKYPAFHAPSYKTEKGIYYLKEPGVALIAQSVPNPAPLKGFLEGFDPELNFGDYLNDPDKLDPAAQLIKIAGQTCYMSFGPKRTKNANVQDYVNNLVGSGHGSVLEHPNFTFLIYGVSRSFTHELVRHRAGMGFSQESQRYVGGNVLRFIERPEFQNIEELHRNFETRIGLVAEEYEGITTKLLVLQQKGFEMISAEVATDKRKKVRQASRAVLTNETEAVIVATGNVRSWRHIISMRVNEHAEIEIRKAIFKIYQCLNIVEPTSFKDFEVIDLPDGTKAVKTNHPKV